MTGFYTCHFYLFWLGKELFRTDLCGFATNEVRKHGKSRRLLASVRLAVALFPWKKPPLSHTVTFQPYSNSFNLNFLSLHSLSSRHFHSVFFYFFGSGKSCFEPTFVALLRMRCASATKVIWELASIRLGTTRCLWQRILFPTPSHFNLTAPLLT